MIDCALESHLAVAAVPGTDRHGLSARTGGYLCFEFGMGQGDDVCRILEENGYTILERSRDYNERERAVLAQYGRKEA